MLAQTPKLPPALQRIATTPVPASERPPGFLHVKITRLGPNKRAHTLGIVRIDFSNRHTSESAGYALLKTHTAAVRFARQAETIKARGLLFTKAVRFDGSRSQWRQRQRQRRRPCLRSP
jgi:hypothetical protein